MQRLFIYNNLKAMAARGTAEQVALTEWLVNELNKPPREQTLAAASLTTHEYKVPGSGQELVRVFYLAHPGSPAHLQEIAVAARSSAEVWRVFLNNAQQALALRGTADQMAMAEPLVRQMDTATGAR